MIDAASVTPPSCKDQVNLTFVGKQLNAIKTNGVEIDEQKEFQKQQLVH